VGSPTGALTLCSGDSFDIAHGDASLRLKNGYGQDDARFMDTDFRTALVRIALAV